MAPLPQIATVCRVFPSADQPGAGVYVLRRAAAVAQLAPLRLLQPCPWFPLLKPRPREGSASLEGLALTRQPMFYLPSVLKSWDARWLERSIRPVLARWQQAGEITLVDAHFGYPDGVGAVRAASRLGLPVFVTMRGLEAVYLKKPGFREQLVAALRRATGVIAVGHGLRELAMAEGVDPDRVRVISNAVDETVFHPRDRRQARGELGLDPDRPLVVSVGNLLHGKGHHLVIEAVARLRAQRPGLQLVVLGGAAHEPAYPGQLERLIHEHRLNGDVRLLGAVPQPQVARWLAAADLFALATFREGCCNAVLEALASGLPVVTTPVGDNARFVVPERDGFLVPVDDAAELARGIERTLAATWDPPAISRRVVGGGWRKVGEQVLEFFQERLAATGKVPPR